MKDKTSISRWELRIAVVTIVISIIGLVGCAMIKYGDIIGQLSSINTKVDDVEISQQNLTNLVQGLVLKPNSRAQANSVVSLTEK